MTQSVCIKLIQTSKFFNAGENSFELCAINQLVTLLLVNAFVTEKKAKQTTKSTIYN